MNSSIWGVWSARMAVTITSAVWLAACSKAVPPEEPIRAVKLMTVGVAATQSTLEYAGEVRARVESRIGFRVGGKLLARPVEPGQRVKAGQLLAQLDAQDLKLVTDAARAQVAAAQTSRDLALADFKRFQALKAQNFISGAELERRDAVQKGAQAQLDQAQAQLTAQGHQAGYASLHADFAGVVTAVLAEPGQVLAAGTPVLQLAQDGARDVVFAVPEDKVAAIKPGSAVQVVAWSSAVTHSAVVREVAASADPVTRTFSIKVALPASADLALGSTVTVWPQALQHVGTPVLKLPTSALRQDGQQTAVWLLDKTSMTLRSQPVQIASADGNDVVLASGLNVGDWVVVAGVHVLAAGQKVTVYKENRPVAKVNQAQSATEYVAASVPSAAASAQ